MKIAKIEMGIVRIPLITPFKTALRTVEEVEDVIVRITSANGETGYGEAPPTKAITGETLESIQETIAGKIAPALRSMKEGEPEDFLKKIQSCCAGNSSAKAAMDIAVYDLAAREAGVPLYRYLAPRSDPQQERRQFGIPGSQSAGERREIFTDLTISVNPVPQMVEDAKIAVKRGFTEIKIKVGKEGEKDLERIRAIREAVGETVGIRVDANQGWTPQAAVKILTRAEKMGLQLSFVEQPVKAEDLEGMAYVKAHTHTMVVADESCFHPSDAQDVFAKDAADMVNIKLMKAGGLYEANKIAEIARSYGRNCMIGCMLESKIAVSAAAHFTAAQDVVTAVDLDGPSLCAEDPYIGGPRFEGAAIRMNETPGLGIIGIKEAYLSDWQELR
ncbi:MAG: dipeptide epimerase [Eubacteriales bacterium]|nr:dipeptide epimerase [Eubacteriales bacterium]